MEGYVYKTDNEEIRNGLIMVVADLVMIYVLLSDFGIVPSFF